MAGLVTHACPDRLGRSLTPSELDPVAAARWFFEAAPFCLLVHDTAADPRFVYVNRTALACSGFEWEEMTCLRSRLSAEAPSQAAPHRGGDAPDTRPAIAA